MIVSTAALEDEIGETVETLKAYNVPLILTIVFHTTPAHMTA